MSNSISCPRCGREFPRPAPGDYACPDCQSVVKVESAPPPDPRREMSFRTPVRILAVWMLVTFLCIAYLLFVAGGGFDVLFDVDRRGEFLILVAAAITGTATLAFVAMMVWWTRLRARTLSVEMQKNSPIGWVWIAGGWFFSVCYMLVINAAAGMLDIDTTGGLESALIMPTVVAFLALMIWWFCLPNPRSAD